MEGKLIKAERGYVLMIDIWIKILYWVIRITSMVLLAPVVVVAIPGAILYFISEEIEDRKF